MLDLRTDRKIEAMTEKFRYEDRALLDDAWRHEHLDPHVFWRRVGLEPGQVVVDVGAGTGYFALPAAEAAGPTGRVYACDVSPRMVAHINARARERGYKRVEALLSTESALPLPTGHADLVLAAFVLHEAANPYCLLEELGRVVASRGRILILDWRPDAAEPANLPRRQRWAPATVLYMLREAGLTPGPVCDLNEANYLIEAFKT
jgi:ubiquinone/menaquinone biosynthesis C-methylase UbiE